MQTTISGKEAISRMKTLKSISYATFGLLFYTCNLNTGVCGEVRKYERCAIRSAMLDELSTNPGEHYLFFTDTDNELPRQCFRRLIRQVCFDGQTWLKVKWFDE